eukprot:6880527-Pyramimonas_sp.AAC.1
MRKIEHQERAEARIEEMREAWEQRDLARAGRWSRLISGGICGPRNRDYWAATTANPRHQEWIGFWQQSGGAGGMDCS